MRQSRPADDPPSIVYFVSTLSAGGAQIGMVRLLCGLDLDRYDVTVVTVGSRGADVAADLPERVRLIDLQGLSRLRAPWVLYRTIDSADVLVCSLYHATICGRLCGTVARRPVIVNWHHSERFSGYGRELLYRATSPLSDLILADSRPVARRLRTEYGVSPERVQTVPIAGIDTDRFAPTDASSPSDELHVATVGSLIPAKRHDRILETARVLDGRSGDPEIIFNVAGTGPLAGDLQESRDSMGVDTVRFHGFVEDVPAFLNCNDVYVHTSDYEGLCIAALEAMACELPVVATPAGGLATYVDHGESGYLLSDPNPDAFADAILSLCASDLRRELGQRGRAIVAEGYSRDVLVSSFEAALDAVCSSEQHDSHQPPRRRPTLG